MQHTMNGGTVLQGGGRMGGNAPLALQFESQWANLGALQRTGAESAGQIGGWRFLDPLSDTREQLWLRGPKNVSLELTTVFFSKPELEFAVLHQFAKIARWSSFFSPFSELAVDR